MGTIKKISQVAALVLILGVFGAGIFFWPQIKGALPALRGPSGDIVQEIADNNQEPDETQADLGPGQNATNFPLALPDGMKIEVFAQNLPGARVIAFDSLGNMWVSQLNQGKVSLLEISDGKVTNQTEVFRGLDNPHGLAIDPSNGTMLYLAEEGRVSNVALYTEDTLHPLVSLPNDGGHSSRTIEFGPDGRLYVSIGSSCNACRESDARRAAIYSMNKDGTDFKPFATGLRNAVFFDWTDLTGDMWATENSRDLLGDDVPPDELNIITEGGNYGWPICYGQNVHDTSFDKSTYVRNPCMAPMEKPSAVDIQAHSAPLGIDFVPEEGWPEEYWYDAIVALHGSWNRTEPTGYKLIRVKINDQGQYEGTEDFVTGWLQGNGALGRPVDVLIQPGGVMYVTDDKAGVIYKLSMIDLPR